MCVCVFVCVLVGLRGISVSGLQMALASLTALTAFPTASINFISLYFFFCARLLDKTIHHQYSACVHIIIPLAAFCAHPY